MIPASRKSRNGKRLAAVFAAALVMGLSAASVLAQGSYYPVTPAGPGNPPTGTPIATSDAPELGLIESQLGTATLIVPPGPGKHAASSAEIASAVNASAILIIGNGGTYGSVTLSSLAAQLVNYRSDTAGAAIALRQAALSQLSATIIASSGSKQADLTLVANAVAKAAPDATSLHAFLPSVFSAAANNPVVAPNIQLIVASALVSAASVPATALVAPLDAAGVNYVVGDALSAVVTSSASAANKAIYVGAVVTKSLQAAPVGSNLAFIDAVSAAATAPSNLPYYGGPSSGWLGLAISNEVTAVGGAPSDEVAGAIAQGALRGVSTLADVGKVKTALSNSYTDSLSDAYWTARNATAAAAPAAVAGLPGVGTPHTAAALVAGANVTKGAVGGAILKAVLDATSGGMTSAEAQAIVAAAVGSSQANAAQIASGGVATTNAYAAANVRAKDIAQGGVSAAKVSAAGDIAATVLQAAGLTSLNAIAVVDGAIRGAALASPALPNDGIADIVFKSANALKYQAAASPVTGDMAAQAVTTMLTVGGASAPTYIAAVAALAGDSFAYHRADIFTKVNTADGGANAAAILAGKNMVQDIQTSSADFYKNTLTRMGAAASKSEALAILYGASMANSGGAVAALAAAVATYPVFSASDVSDYTIAAISSNRSQQTALTITRDVSVYMKANPNDILDYVGKQLVSNPNYVTTIATAAVVVNPSHSNYVAHAVAYNSPTTAYNAVSSIFQYSKITIPGVLAVGDRPAAAASITAGLATGILENTQLSVADKKAALVNATSVALYAVASSAYTDVTVGPATFSQMTSSGVPTLQKTKGAAGAVTGFIAQMVKPGDTALDVSGITAAMINAAAYAVRNAYTLDIAQAAGQAAGWVSGGSAAGLVAGIKAAMLNPANGLPYDAFLTAAQVNAAIDYGFAQAAGGTGTPGAGAGGLRKDGTKPFYDHHSATGEPVSNMFSL
jgi:hypothetical protein